MAFTASVSNKVVNGFSEITFIDNVIYPAVRLFADQASGVDVKKRPGRELDGNYNLENPPCPHPRTFHGVATGKWVGGSGRVRQEAAEEVAALWIARREGGATIHAVINFGKEG